MTEELQGKELTDMRYLRARMTGNVGLALSHAYNLGFFDGEKNVAEKIRSEIEEQVLESLSDSGGDWFAAEKVNECLEIIDKYRAEREDK